MADSPHFDHADQIPVEAIAVLADRNIEIHVGIAFIGLRFAQVPGCPRTTHHDAGKAPGPGIVQRHDADIDIALLEDAVTSQKLVDIVDGLQERIDPLANIFDEFMRQVLVNAARTEIGRVHARATGPLVKHHQLFALFKTPERRRQRADVHGLRRDVQKMRQDAADFRIEHADQLATDRHLGRRQLLDGQRIGMLLVHRRDIVETVEIGHSLQIGLGLDQLFGAAMQKPDMRIDPLDDFPVEFEHKPQHAVRRRMLWAEIDVEIPDVMFVHFIALRACGD